MCTFENAALSCAIKGNFNKNGKTRKRRKRRKERNVIGHRAITNVPGQQGGNITLCAATTQMGSSTTMQIWDPIMQSSTCISWQIAQDCHSIKPSGPDAVHCHLEHRAALVHNWFHEHPEFEVLYLPPYSPFLNPIKEVFSAWQWKVYDLWPHDRVPLIQAMEKACDHIEAASVQGWIRHMRRSFQRCLPNKDIACDVDEILWPDAARLRDDE